MSKKWGGGGAGGGGGGCPPLLLHHCKSNAGHRPNVCSMIIHLIHMSSQGQIQKYCEASYLLLYTTQKGWSGSPFLDLSGFSFPPLIVISAMNINSL